MPVNLNGMDPRVLAALKTIQEQARARGIETNLISGVRSREDQEQLYANWIAGQRHMPLPYPERGPVPLAAAPGSSEHEKGFAFDLQASDPSRQSELRSLAPSAGLRVLGSKDPNHFELAYGGDETAHPGISDERFKAALSVFSGVNSSARGIRNNNPGNLVSNSWTASLPGYKGSDGRFAIFDTPEHGAAALDTNLADYGAKGIKSPFAIASRWAPAEDHNNPSSYGAQIAKALGVGLNDNVDLSDPKTRQKIAGAIALVENGPGNGSTPVGGGTAVASTKDDWQSLLGVPNDPGDISNLGSLMSDAVASPSKAPSSVPSMQVADVAPQIDSSYALAAPPPQDPFGPRYQQGREARKLSSLGQLFSLPTIGLPTQQQGTGPQPYKGVG